MGRAILAVIAGALVGQLAQVPLALLLDLIYRGDVTAGRWPLNSANVILVSLVGLLTGLSAGWIAGKRGKLVAAVAQFLPLFAFVTFEMVRNVDLTTYVAQQYETKPALWTWIGLIPAIIGGHYGASKGRQMLSFLAGGLAGSVMVLSSISGLALHGYTCIVAYEASGLGAAVLTFMLPPASEVYWFVRIWDENGVFWNSYSLAVAAWVALLAVGGGLYMAVALTASRKSTAMAATSTPSVGGVPDREDPVETVNNPGLRGAHRGNQPPEPSIRSSSSVPSVTSESKGSRSAESFLPRQLPPDPPSGMPEVPLPQPAHPTGQRTVAPKEAPTVKRKPTAMQLLESARAMSPEQVARLKNPRYLASIRVPPRYRDGYPKPPAEATDRESTEEDPPGRPDRAKGE